MNNTAEAERHYPIKVAGSRFEVCALDGELWRCTAARPPSHGRPHYYECNIPDCTLDGHKRKVAAS